MKIRLARAIALVGLHDSANVRGDHEPFVVRALARPWSMGQVQRSQGSLEAGLQTARFSERGALAVGRRWPTVREPQSVAVQLPGSEAFSLLECLVYVSVLLVIMGLLATIYYHADWNHRNLERNASDMVRTLQAGERWRDDVRQASGPIKLEPAGQGPELSIPHTNGTVRYAFREGAVWRQAGAAGRWQAALTGVLSSRMEKEPRQLVAAWCWDVELKSRQQTPRVRPLFTFEAVPKQTRP
jgi:hypothetical protein